MLASAASELCGVHTSARGLALTYRNDVFSILLGQITSDREIGKNKPCLFRRVLSDVVPCVEIGSQINPVVSLELSWDLEKFAKNSI